MVVEDTGECCGGKPRNFKIHGGVRVHVADIVVFDGQSLRQ